MTQERLVSALVNRGGILAKTSDNSEYVVVLETKDGSVTGASYWVSTTGKVRYGTRFGYAGLLSQDEHDQLASESASFQLI